MSVVVLDDNAPDDLFLNNRVLALELRHPIRPGEPHAPLRHRRRVLVLDPAFDALPLQDGRSRDRGQRDVVVRAKNNEMDDWWSARRAGRRGAVRDAPREVEQPEAVDMLLVLGRRCDAAAEFASARARPRTARPASL